MSSWFMQVFVGLGFAFGFSILFKRIMDKTLQAVSKTSIPWDKALIKSVRSTGVIALWSMAFVFTLKVIDREFEIDWLFSLSSLQHSIWVVILSIFIIKMIDNTEREYVKYKVAHEEKVNTITIAAFAKGARLVIYVVCTMLVLQGFGMSLSGVLALTGASSIVLGLAAKDTLANIFATLSLYADRNFEIGDRVSSSDRTIDGHIADIGWRQTKIINLDKNPIYVPNNLFSNIIVSNKSRMTHRKFEHNFPIKTEHVDKTEEIAFRIRMMLEKHEAVDTSQLVTVALDGFNHYSFNIFVRAYFFETDFNKYLSIQQSAILEIVRIIKEESAEMAFFDNLATSVDMSIK